MAYSEAIAVFKADCSEKKIIANSARKRVGRRRGCKGPYRTPQEVSALNGPCTTYNLNVAMTWEQFTSLPLSIQTEYLRGIANRFGATELDLLSLFHVTDRELRTHLQCNALAGVMKRAQAERFDADGWEQFINCRNDSVMEQIPADNCAERLRSRREELGLTQKQLAEELCCSTASISRAENNKSNYITIIMLLSSVEKLFSQKQAGGMEEAGNDGPVLCQKQAKRPVQKQPKGSLALSGTSDTVISALAKLFDDAQQNVTVTVCFDEQKQ